MMTRQVAVSVKANRGTYSSLLVCLTHHNATWCAHTLQQQGHGRRQLATDSSSSTREAAAAAAAAAAGPRQLQRSQSTAAVPRSTCHLKSGANHSCLRVNGTLCNPSLWRTQTRNAKATNASCAPKYVR